MSRDSAQGLERKCHPGDFERATFFRVLRFKKGLVESSSNSDLALHPSQVHHAEFFQYCAISCMGEPY